MTNWTKKGWKPAQNKNLGYKGWPKNVEGPEQVWIKRRTLRAAMRSSPERESRKITLTSPRGPLQRKEVDFREHPTAMCEANSLELLLTLNRKLNMLMRGPWRKRPGDEIQSGGKKKKTEMPDSIRDCRVGGLQPGKGKLR